MHTLASVRAFADASPAATGGWPNPPQTAHRRPRRSTAAVSTAKDASTAIQPSRDNNAGAPQSSTSTPASSSRTSSLKRRCADIEQAAELDPANTDYALAADVARSHAVTALIQAAAKDRMRGDDWPNARRT